MCMFLLHFSRSEYRKFAIQIISRARLFYLKMFNSYRLFNVRNYSSRVIKIPLFNPTDLFAMRDIVSSPRTYKIIIEI